MQGQADRAYKVIWTPAEQRDLDSAMTRFPETKHTPLERYLRIATALPHKVGLQIPLNPADTVPILP